MMFSFQTDEFRAATPKSLFHFSFIKWMGRNGLYIEKVSEFVDYSSVSPRISTWGIHRVFCIVKNNAVIINVLHGDGEMGIRRIQKVGSMRDSGFINSAQDLAINGIKKSCLPFHRN